MPSVAFITDAPRVAGSEVWLLDLLPLLPQHGLTPALYLPATPALDAFSQELAERGVPTVRYESRAALPALTRACDLRVVQCWEPSSYRALLPVLAAPRVVVSHDQLDYHYPAPVRALYREIFRFTKASTFRQADGVITVSGWGHRFLAETMGLSAAQGMTNGVDPEQFRPAGGEEWAALREAFGFGRFTVIVPGRFTLEKNQLSAVLTASFAPELDFVFVGDMDSGFGRLARALKSGLKLRNVRFLGRRRDMPELYRASDVLLQPTLAENQSLVTLEAMASGLPVVTSDIPAQKELVRDGLDGLCLPAQPEGLAQALKALAAHPEKRAQMGEQARARVLANHTRQQSAAQLARLLLGFTRGR